MSRRPPDPPDVADDVVPPDSDTAPARRDPQPPLLVGTETPNDYNRYAIYRGSLLIGSSNLEVAVETGARAAGVFRATGLFRSIAPVFALYDRAVRSGDARMLKEFVRQRDALRLEVWRAGTRLQARVDHISTWRPGHHVIHVSSTDPAFWHWRLPDA